ncbi:MAG: hypothetical protein LBI87_10780 [Candidatus Accumulibacter sp.]|jgi:hypothetical protein|nr:hypothetical protein [Accumulibacter sp.]
MLAEASHERRSGDTSDAALAWIWAWITTAKRWVARGKGRIIACLFGAFSGWGAAAAVFVLIGAILMPNVGDRLLMIVPCALMLLMYFCVLYRPKNGAQGIEADATSVPAESRAASPGAWRLEEERRLEEKRRRKKSNRASREKALGMSPGDFFDARIKGHLIFWRGILFIAVWGCLFILIQPAESHWLMRLIASLAVICLPVAIRGAIFVPAVILLVLALLPLAGIRVAIEAWWRIRHNEPFIAPPVVDHADPASSAPCASHHGPPDPPPTPRPNGGDWLVPLVIGLWTGHSRDKED